MSSSTMTRMGADSFLPSGSIDTSMRFPLPSLGDSSSSLISPLALPRGAGYFDLASVTSNPTLQAPSKLGRHVYSPLSPNFRGPAAAHMSQFMSPNLAPIQQGLQYQFEQQQQQRSTSVPPNLRRSKAGQAAKAQFSVISPPLTTSMDGLSASSSGDAYSGVSVPAISSVSAGQPRSASADAVNAPSHAQMVRRLVQQNGRIREAWEAERKYLEANRERAEEVYKEERALMEEERAEWEAEKTVLLQEIQRLQQQVAHLGGQSSNANLAALAAAHASNNGLIGNMRWGEVSPESMRSSRSSQGSTQHVQTQQPEQQQPTSVNTIPGPQGPVVADSMAQSPELRPSSPAPVVDVQAIHPELEGIPIKANSVQRSTFTDGSAVEALKSPTKTPSPPPPAGMPEPEATEPETTEPDITEPRSESPAKEQTKQVLKAEASVRLTMHAGHTPSHSLSVLATATSSGVATINSSGSSTPTLPRGDDLTSQALGVISEQEGTIQLAEQESVVSDDPLAAYEPAEDRPLRGPLMVRNMPAHDEIFFRRLSDKLEEVSKDTMAALPSVLKDTVVDDGEPGPSNAKENEPENSSKEKDSSSGSKSEDETELDIPLKLRRNNNFGAPFGEFKF
ncbi:hypothetical protein B0T20DRAFT_261904 [Sordaria brevicollis]|uniref:Uncharacterized protein n=1 Tax=Sordaria brevicollis TaxID=83679 RepID=A0AAE0UA21_SORBR|nr:hypothetical protein B0T20DRAFT_261904 [Sordaria brevicollis]